MNGFDISVRDLMHKPGTMRRAEFEIDLPEDLSNSILSVSA
ncbi:MAG: DUF177 domain-containing protein, partial [Actinobacteria bacterium]|nr:DUF177 domain-containing protein [Actinomycetota bacterium]